MIKGSTIIMNDDYISELTRHRDNWIKKAKVETNPHLREQLEQKAEYLNQKLESALEFQDTVDEIINVEVPRIMAIRTIGGLVIPAKNVQVV